MVILGELDFLIVIIKLSNTANAVPNSSEKNMVVKKVVAIRSKSFQALQLIINVRS
jgi:hypothetical protein